MEDKITLQYIICFLIQKKNILLLEWIFPKYLQVLYWWSWQVVMVVHVYDRKSSLDLKEKFYQNLQDKYICFMYIVKHFKFHERKAICVAILSHIFDMHCNTYYHLWIGFCFCFSCPKDDLNCSNFTEWKKQEKCRVPEYNPYYKTFHKLIFC